MTGAYETHLNRVGHFQGHELHIAPMPMQRRPHFLQRLFYTDFEGVFHQAVEAQHAKNVGIAHRTAQSGGASRILAQMANEPAEGLAIEFFDG